MRINKNKIVTFVILSSIIAIRLIYLNADSVSIQDIHNQDEGNYSMNVRNYAVEGVFIKDQTNFFFLTPVFSSLQLPFVLIFGVHFWSFRLVNAITALLTIGLGYWFLKKEIAKKTAAIFVVLLGFNFLYLVLLHLLITLGFLSANNQSY